jgi:hypothetical protein
MKGPLEDGGPGAVLTARRANDATGETVRMSHADAKAAVPVRDIVTRDVSHRQR